MIPMKSKRISSATDDLYQSIVFNFPDPIIIHSSGKVLYANRIVLEVTGLDEVEIMGRKLRTLFFDPENPSQQLFEDRQFSELGTGEEEVEIRTANRKVLIKAYLLHNSKVRFHGQNAIITVMRDITERKQMERLVMRKVVETEEKDRRQFAIDLHDDLGPILSSIKIHLGLLDPSADPERFISDHNHSKALLNEAISKMRIIANNLMPRLIDTFGLEASLRSFITGITRKGVFHVDMTSNLGDHRLPKQTELQIYRILTELMNNTVKHSGASRAFLRIRKKDGIISFSYSDNGKGYNYEEMLKPGKGMGLANIRHRVFLVDGTLKFYTRSGRTYVSISLPC